MIYEMRRYECYPGKLRLLHRVMKEIALPNFHRHGMEFVAGFTPIIGDDEECLIYILRFDDMGTWKAKWEAFNTDKQWIEQRGAFAAEAGGPLVSKRTNVFLEATDYSPI